MTERRPPFQGIGGAAGIRFYIISSLDITGENGFRTLIPFRVTGIGVKKRQCGSDNSIAAVSHSRENPRPTPGINAGYHILSDCISSRCMVDSALPAVQRPSRFIRGKNPTGGNTERIDK